MAICVGWACGADWLFMGFEGVGVALRGYVCYNIS